MITGDQIKLIRELLPMSRLVGDDGYVLCGNGECGADGRHTCEVYDDHTFCHKCRKREDQIDYLMRTRNLEWLAAVRLAASMAGVPLEANRERSELLVKCQAELHKQLFLHSPEKLKDLIEWRGWSRHTIGRLNLGYSDPEGEALRRTGLSTEDLIELGFYTKPEPGKSPFFIFADRYIFPIKNTKGQLVSMKGRLARGYTEFEEKRRGKNLPLRKDSERWGPHSHMDHLFLEEHLDAARRAGFLVITEGEPNGISLFDHRIPVAALQMNRGLAKFAHLLTRKDKEGRYIKRIYSCLDNDEATMKVVKQELYELQLMLLPEQRLHFTTLPYLNGPGQKLDVDEFFHAHQKTREDFVDLLKGSPDITHVLIRDWGRDLRNHQFLHVMLHRLKIRQDELLPLFAEVTNRDPSILRYAIETCRLDPRSVPAAA